MWTAQDSRAQAKAMKAHAKAMRPWYRKKRWWLLGAVVAIIGISVAASGGSDKTNTATTTGNAGVTTTTVAKGLGSKDASADVHLGALGAPDVLKMRTATLTITNNSSKRSDYYIELSAESADGKTQYDTAAATATNVEPGQTTNGDVLPFTKTMPADAVVVVKSVQRTAS